MFRNSFGILHGWSFKIKQRTRFHGVGSFNMQYRKMLEPVSAEQFIILFPRVLYPVATFLVFITFSLFKISCLKLRPLYLYLCILCNLLHIRIKQHCKIFLCPNHNHAPFLDDLGILTSDTFTTYLYVQVRFSFAL